MKKSIIATIVVISGLASAAMAGPSFVPVDFICPSAVGAGPHVLSRFSGMIAGYGEEVINGNPAFNAPYFQYYISTASIPAKLTSYINDGTDYDSTTGTVSCKYSSTGPNDAFIAVYQMTNGIGGQVISSTPDTISINQPIGFKA